jgi:asparagine synthase (glutamine-hydrolysing)
MCGIAGLCGRQPPLEALGAMAGALAHRGPDGVGFAVAADGGERIHVGPEPAPVRGEHLVGLAHLRLAIIDLSEANRQPSLDESGQVALSYNGEVYNYVELREELRALGHRFTTTGDTEVVLRSYLQWGTACVDRFVGMWAFAIADLREGRVFLSRDRFGIKPLFWTALPGGGLAFASEIKALAAVPGVRWEPDPITVKRYLVTGAVDDRDETFFAGVQRVPPATNLVLPIADPVSGMRSERYWSPAPAPTRTASDRDAADVRETLREAVRVHLRSDVPVGTCLSGGIDSSGVVALCDELRRSGDVGHYTHHAFGYVPPDEHLSERPFMEAVARRSGAELTVVQPTAGEFHAGVLDVVCQQDEPFGSLSIAAQHFVFAAARRDGMKVMLDGQGADEIFAGYHQNFVHAAGVMLRRRRLLAYLRFAGRHYRAYRRMPVSFAQLAAAAPLAGVSRQVQPAKLAGPALRDLPLRATASPESLHELLIQHTMQLPLQSLLRFEDRNSMAHSIEGRVPYLDHRLVELAFSLPEDVKLSGVVPKAVLRRALADALPPEVLARRDKIGFRADASATHRLAREHAAALAEARTHYEREWLEPGTVAELLATRDESDAAEFALWRVVNLKLWLRQFWDPERDAL